MPVELPARPPRSEVRPLTTEVAAPTTATVTPSAPTAMQGAAEPVAPPPTRSEAAPARQQSTDDARLPRFADLVVLGQLNVPHMHIDIHVFSTTPADRFVFINMRRYNEGQSTQEGPRVERITRDGVVMEHQGQRFFLSRD
jgi:general secretion pathway protein B